MRLRYRLLGLLAVALLLPAPPLSPAQDQTQVQVIDADQIHLLINDLSTTNKWEAAVKELQRIGKPASDAIPALEDTLSRLSDPSDRWDVIKALRAIGGVDQPAAAAAYADIKRDNAMIDAALAGDDKAVDKGIHDGASVNARYLDFDSFFDYGKSGYTALMGAALAGKTDLVKHLIGLGADVNAERRGKTALHIAVLANDQALLKVLQDAGAKGDAQHIRLVHDMVLAACKGFEAKPNDKPQPPGVPGDLQFAQTIAIVLSRGGNASTADEEGFTPLMYAANLGMVKNVQELLNAGADPTVSLRNGISALTLADAGAKAGREGCAAAADLLRSKLPKK